MIPLETLLTSPVPFFREIAQKLITLKCPVYTDLRKNENYHFYLKLSNSSTIALMYDYGTWFWFYIIGLSCRIGGGESRIENGKTIGNGGFARFEDLFETIKFVVEDIQGERKAKWAFWNIPAWRSLEKETENESSHSL